MFALGYVGAVGLFGLAGVKAIQARHDCQTASLLEEAMNTPAPTEEGKTAYIALQCLGNLHFSLWFPTEHEVLVGRYHVVKSKPHIDVGIGFTNNDNKDLIVTATPHNQKKEYSISLPKELTLQNGTQEVIVHHLDMAQWVGAFKKVTYHRPQNAAILLKEIHVEPDLTARYQLTAEWFENNQITLFGQATQIEGRLYIKQPLKDLPFIATPEAPAAFVASLKSTGQRLQKECKQDAVIATLFTSASRAYQLKQELPAPFKAHQWLYLRQFPQLKKIYGCVAVCALAGAALQTQFQGRN